MEQLGMSGGVAGGEGGELLRREVRLRGFKPGDKSDAHEKT